MRLRNVSDKCMLVLEVRRHIRLPVVIARPDLFGRLLFWAALSRCPFWAIGNVACML